jgi:cytochrome P450
MLLIVFAFLSTAVLSLLYSCWLIYCYVKDAKRLRRFPSLTPLAGITYLPWIWASIRLRRFLVLHEAHQHAPIIRIGPNALSLNDSRAAQVIYGHGTQTIKDSYYDSGAGPYRHLADTRDKQEHSRKRRILASGYALTTVVKWEHKIANRIQALVNQYDCRCGPTYGQCDSASPVDHRRWMDLFTIDVICDIGLSAGLRLLEKGDDVLEVQNADGKTYQCRFRESLWRGHTIHMSFAWLPTWYKTIRRLTCWDSRWKDAEAFGDIVTTQCKRRLDRYLAGEKLDDFFAYLLELKTGSMNMLPLGEMIAECSVMLNAGSDTTGIALTNCLYLLIKNPSCLQKLRSEVDEAFPEDDIVAKYDRIKYLPYLKACLDESLRLHPPSATTTPRMTPQDGLEIMGEWIPGNTTVLCPTYTLHRHPSAFQDPENFNPERWLDVHARSLQEYFLPFSAGARGCIGRNITYMEQMMLIATLVHRYNFALPSPNWELSHTEAVTCSPGSMPVYVSRRKNVLTK